MIGACSFVEIDTKNFATHGKKAATLDNDIFRKNLKRLNAQALKKRYPHVQIETDTKKTQIQPLLKKKWAVAKQSLTGHHLKNGRAIVYGNGLAHGIFSTTMQLLKKGFQVWMVVDAIQSCSGEDREMDLMLLRKEGAQMWNTEFILKNT